MTISKKIEGDIKHKVSVVINRALKEMEYFKEELDRMTHCLPTSEGTAACNDYLASNNADLVKKLPICEPRAFIDVNWVDEEVRGIRYKIEGIEGEPAVHRLKSLGRILAIPGPVEVTDDDLAVIASLYAKQST